MKWIGRLMGMGLMIWLVPGATSFGWYDRSGKLTISLDLVKTIVMADIIQHVAATFTTLGINFFKINNKKDL